MAKHNGSILRHISMSYYGISQCWSFVLVLLCPSSVFINTAPIGQEMIMGGHSNVVTEPPGNFPADIRFTLHPLGCILTAFRAHSNRTQSGAFLICAKGRCPLACHVSHRI